MTVLLMKFSVMGRGVDNWVRLEAALPSFDL
jgi:hypothetical protein